MLYGMNDIFFTCVGLALNNEIICQKSEIRVAEFKDVNEYAETIPDFGGMGVIRDILKSVAGKVQTEEDLRRVLALQSKDISFSKRINSNSKGLIYYPKYHKQKI